MSALGVSLLVEMGQTIEDISFETADSQNGILLKVCVSIEFFFTFFFRYFELRIVKHKNRTIFGGPLFFLFVLWYGSI